MRYIWFWTFWHWSKESFRSGAVLRGPLHGIGGHWDEWFRHETSEADRRSIENIGRTETGQRKFMLWICRSWLPEANPNRNRFVARFILGQLAQVPPFNAWRAFSTYRTSYRSDGVRAIVLADKSPGEPADIRNVEALLLPPDADGTAPALVTEEFQAEPAELQSAIQASKSLLRGSGFLRLLAWWLVAGRRPYSRWLSASLFLGWLAVVGLILALLFGPEPGDWLFLIEAVLVGLWVSLMLVEVVVVTAVAWRAWQTGVALSNRLEKSQTRLRMNGGLTLKGGSAGLPFCLNMLSSLYRANPRDVRSAWLWGQFFRRSCTEGRYWAATGVVTADGRIKQVVLGPKLRASLRHGGIREILTPKQPEATNDAEEAFADAPAKTMEETTESARPVSQVRLGFAAEKPSLHIHRCGHIAKAVMELGGLRGGWQVYLNAFALLVSMLMLAALPDLRSILLPYSAPAAVPPSSPSPYALWVSLNTKHPAYFRVILESEYWSNRRSEVRRHTELTPSVRAEIPFHRLTGMSAANEEDGVVWIERRRRFLTREFLPGERVGHYAIPYLSHLGHE